MEQLNLLHLVAGTIAVGGFLHGLRKLLDIIINFNYIVIALTYKFLKNRNNFAVMNLNTDPAYSMGFWSTLNELLTPLEGLRLQYLSLDHYYTWAAPGTPGSYHTNCFPGVTVDAIPNAVLANSTTRQVIRDLRVVEMRHPIGTFSSCSFITEFLVLDEDYFVWRLA